MKTVNNVVLVKPFAEKGIIMTQSATGIAYVGNTSSLMKSTVLADGPNGIKTGDIIYVSGQSSKAPWTKLIYELWDGVTGILVPLEAVVLVESP